MEQTSWDEVAGYVSAASLVELQVGADFASARLRLIYGNGRVEAPIELRCTDCAYVDWRRLHMHEPGSGAVFEAALRTTSPLIDALRSHQLESRAGCLSLEAETDRGIVRHLELIGEVSVNILCREVSVVAGRLPEEDKGR